MAKRPDESIEQTAARLGLGSEPVPKLASPMHQGRVRAGSGRAVVVGIVMAVIAAVVVIVLVAISIAGVVSGSRGPFGNSWSNYPGTKYDDPRAILSSPSKEEVVGDADAFVREFKQKLGERYHLIWIEEWEGDTRLASNGYDGDSMLYDYSGANWLGAAAVDDPDARQDVIDLFEQLAAEYGSDEFRLTNDLYTDADDTEYAISQFGSTVRSKQALLSAHADKYPSGLSMNIDVYDTTIPVDASFDGDYISKRIELDEGDATLFISLNLNAYGLLSEGDRDKFIERIGDYDEDNKP